MAVTLANRNICRLTTSRLRECRKREGRSRKGAKAGDEVAQKTAAVQTNEVLTTINSFCMYVFFTRC